VRTEEDCGLEPKKERKGEEGEREREAARRRGMGEGVPASASLEARLRSMAEASAQVQQGEAGRRGEEGDEESAGRSTRNSRQGSEEFSGDDDFDAVAAGFLRDSISAEHPSEGSSHSKQGSRMQDAINVPRPHSRQLLSHSSADEDRFEGKRVIAEFLRGSTCYDVVPKSCKVVVFDRNVPIRLAYYALVEHDITAAPLWDPVTQKLSGMLTTLDFIEMLRFAHSTGTLLEVLDAHSVASWRSLVMQLREAPDLAKSLKDAGMPGVSAASEAAAATVSDEDQEGVPNTMNNGMQDFLFVEPDASLYEACRRLRKNSAHWIPIVDVKKQVCLGVLTHLAVLHYLVTEFCEDRQLFEQPIESLGIGTTRKKRKIITGTMWTPVHEILTMLSANKISCVPILNEDGYPVAVYSRTNVIDLTTHNTIENSLDVPLGKLVYGEAFDNVDGVSNTASDGVTGLGTSEGGFSVASSDSTTTDVPEGMRLYTCKRTDTLQQIFIKFAEVRVHRLMFIDEDGKLEGIVSLTDLLSYFLDDFD